MTIMNSLLPFTAAPCLIKIAVALNTSERDDGMSLIHSEYACTSCGNEWDATF